MSTLITVLHVIVCLFLMLTVLLQSGKGGGMGAAFGGGNAATVFGGSGASGFLKRLTAIAGTIFMITSMVLAFISSRGSADSLDSYGKEQDEAAQRKETLKVDIIKQKRATGSASGSGSAVVPPPAPPAGSATPPAGSATPPAAGSAATPATGSAAPAEQPPAPPTGGTNDAKGSAAPNSSSTTDTPNAPKP